MNFDDKCMLLIMGDSLSGKTSILNKFLNNKINIYNSLYSPTFGIDLVTKDCKIGNKDIRIKIWDTSGDKRYMNLLKGYIPEAQGYIIVYDLTKQDSLIKIKNYFQIINELNKYKRYNLIIIGNKKDKKVINNNDIINFCEKIKVKHYEVSAIYSDEINDAIISLAEVILSNEIDILEKVTKRKEKEMTRCCQSN